MFHFGNMEVGLCTIYGFLFCNLFLWVTNDDSEPWVPLSGQQSLPGGAEVCVSFNCVVFS